MATKIIVIQYRAHLQQVVRQINNADLANSIMSIEHGWVEVAELRSEYVVTVTYKHAQSFTDMLHFENMKSQVMAY